MGESLGHSYHRQTVLRLPVAVVAEQLVKTFVTPEAERSVVLDVPTFTVEAAEQVALVGGSGTGKTTLLHCLAGIIRPDSGHVRYGEVELTTLSESQRDAFRGGHIGYVFQTHHLLPGFTALENVLLGMSFTGRRADRGWATHLLEAVGLADRLQYRPGKLSVGQQQRVAVARALANRPTVVYADEPTGALDPPTAQTVLDLIRRLCDEVSAALVVVTHDRGLAGQLPRTVDLADINRAVHA
jgi:putative ABC transport system ATP-binding protein